MRGLAAEQTYIRDGPYDLSVTSLSTLSRISSSRSIVTPYCLRVSPYFKRFLLARKDESAYYIRHSAVAERTRH